MTVICELLGAAVALSVFPLVMMAEEEEGAASGWIEVKGQRVALKHAFAAMSEDVLERGKEKIEVLLSDKPVPMELRKGTDAWSSWAGDAAQKGELHGIILYINPDTKVWSRGQRLSRNGMEFYSQSVSSPELSDLVFAPASAGPGEIAGKVSMKQAMQGVDESGGPWRVEVEFRTRVVARPAVTGSFTGAAARDSAPYKAVQAHLLACQKRDLEGIRKTMSPDSQKMLAMFEAAQGKNAVLDMFTEEAAGTLKLKLTRVTVRGDTAEVVLSGDGKESGSEQVMRLMLDNGAWKIGQ
jgi:ketosteroid isomerase-like protein